MNKKRTKNAAELALEQAKYLDMVDEITKLATNSVKNILEMELKTVEFTIAMPESKEQWLFNLCNKAITTAFIITGHIRMGKLATDVDDKVLAYASGFSL